MSAAPPAASAPGGSPAPHPTGTRHGRHLEHACRNGVTYPLQYDIVNDFEPIALLADAPLLFLGKKALAANDLKELIAWLKANPDTASMATTGAGGPGHLLALLMQKQTGTRFGLVPYRGANPGVQDVVAGQIDMMIANPATAMPHVRAGPRRLPESRDRERWPVIKRPASRERQRCSQVGAARHGQIAGLRRTRVSYQRHQTTIRHPEVPALLRGPRG